MNANDDSQIGPQVRRGSRMPPVLVPTLVALALLAGMQTATQFFAQDFGHHPSLGASYGGIYAPWSIFVWAIAWYAQHPEAFERPATVGFTVSGLALMCAAVVALVRLNTDRPNAYLHGSARWANRKDIEAAALVQRRRFWDAWFPWAKAKPAPQDGVYVGGWLDRWGRLQYLRHSGPEHVLCYAPTRSGKGVALVVPTLLSWPHSALITDLKGELWALTAGWRQSSAKNFVLRFEPAAADGGARWNPLDEIRIATPFEVGDVQNLATLLVDPDGKGLDSHWQKTAQSLLVGLILHALYKAREDGVVASMAGIDSMLSQPDRSVQELWMEMTQHPHLGAQGVHAVIAAAGRDMMDREEREATSVLSATKTYLSLYRDPIVAANTASSSFRIADLMHHEKPVSLYLVTQPNDKARLRPLVRVMVNMFLRMLTSKLEFQGGAPVVTYKHRLLAMLDEFPSLGRLDILQESLAFVAGYGIKCYLICQDINQLKSREAGYGPDETITSQCAIQTAFPPNRLETAEHLSKLTGQTTARKTQITISGGRASFLFSKASQTIVEVARPLLTPDECLRMPSAKKDEKGKITDAGDMLIYVNGYPVIYGRQPLYFFDPVFSRRAAIAPPPVSDSLYANASGASMPSKQAVSAEASA